MNGKPIKKKIHRNSKLVPEGERKCPICGETMHIEKIGTVSTDVCSDHGIWMDKGEYTKIKRRIQMKMKNINAQAVRQAKHDGKVAGVTMGAWSFLYY